MTESLDHGLIVLDDTDASSTSTGSLRLAGGASILKSLVVGGRLTASSILTSSTDNAISATTGGLITPGGLGVAKDIFSGGSITAASLTLNGNASLQNIQGTRIDLPYLANTDSYINGFRFVSTEIGGGNHIQSFGTRVSGNFEPIHFSDHSAASLKLSILASRIHVPLTTASTSTTTGALTVAGGIGVAGAIQLGGTLTGTTGILSTLVRTPMIGVNITPAYQAHILSSTSNNTNMLRLAMPNLGSADPISTSIIYGCDAFGTGDISAKISFIRLHSAANGRTAIAFSTTAGGTTGTDYSVERFRIGSDGETTVSSTLNATSATTGAFRVSGGVGIARNLFVEGANGILLPGVDDAFITKGYNHFTSGKYNGIGRWGMFMEPAALVVGIPTGAAHRTFAIAGYAADSTHTPWVRVFADTGVTNVTGTTESTSVTTGALTIGGGVGISKALFVGGAIAAGSISGASITGTGNMSVTATTESTSATTGAITTTGGIGISKSLFVGGAITAGNISGASITGTGALSITAITDSTSSTTGSVTTAGGVGIAKALVVGGAITGSSVSSGSIASTATTESISAATGAITTAGGVGIAKSVFVGGNLSATNITGSGNAAITATTDSTTTGTGAITTAGGVGIAKSLNVGGNISGGALSGSTITGSGNLSITAVADSTSTATGSITTLGGAGIAKSLFVGGTATANQIFIGTQDVGATLASKANSADVYTKTATDSLLAAKQDVITAGTGLTKTGATLAVDPTQTFTNLNVSTNTALSGNGGLLRLTGTDHVYMELYRTTTSGRTAYFGYQNAGSPNLQLNTSSPGNSQFDIVSNVTITGSLSGTSTTMTGTVTSAGLTVTGDSSLRNIAATRIDIPYANLDSYLLGYRFVSTSANNGNYLQSFNARTAGNFEPLHISDHSANSLKLSVLADRVHIPLSTASTSATTGALTVAGGLGVSGTLTGTSSVMTTLVRTPLLGVNVTPGTYPAHILATAAANTNILRLAMPNLGSADPINTSIVYGSDAFGVGDISAKISFIRLHSAANGRTAIAFSTSATGTGGTDYSVERFRIGSDGETTVYSTANATSATTGAFMVSGGIGVSKNMFVGGPNGIMLPAVDDAMITKGYDPFTSGKYSGIGRWGLFMEPATLVVGIANTAANRNFAIAGYAADSTHTPWFRVFGNTGVVNVTGTTESTSTGTGTLTVAGGVGISKALFVGGRISTGSGATVSQTANDRGSNSLEFIKTRAGLATQLNDELGHIAWQGAAGNNTLVRSAYIISVVESVSSTILSSNLSFITRNAAGVEAQRLGISGEGIVTISNTTASTSATTGALQVSGGAGIGGNVFAGGKVLLPGADDAIITRGWDTFTSGRLSGNGRWGLFMESATLNLGCAMGNANRRVAISGYNADSTYTEWFRVYADGGATQVLSTAASTSATTGALTVAGGVGISKDLFVAGAISTSQRLSSTATTESTTTTTGAITTAGGIGIAKNVTVGGTITTAGLNTTGTLFGSNASFTGWLGVPGMTFDYANNSSDNIYFRDSASAYTWSIHAKEDFNLARFTSGGTYVNVSLQIVRSTGNININGATSITNTTDSTSATTGALQVSGGAGFAGNVFAGGKIILPAVDDALITRKWNPFTSGKLVGNGAWGVFMEAATLNIGCPGGDPSTGVSISGYAADSTYTQWFRVTGHGLVRIFSTTDSSSSTTGALTVSGGVGVAKNLVVGGTLTTAGFTATGTSSLQAITGTRIDIPYTTTEQFLSGLRFISTGAGNGNYIQTHNARTAGNFEPLHFSDHSAASLKLSIFTDRVHVPLTTTSSSTTTGALTVAGGVGIAGALNLGGKITGTTAQFTDATVAVSTGNAQYISSANSTTGAAYYTLRTNNSANIATYYMTSAGEQRIEGGNGTLRIAQTTLITNTTNSTSAVTGALQVSGGAGFAGNVFSSGKIMLPGADDALITRGFDTFTSGKLNGNGRWGLFMEPFTLNLGCAMSGANQRVAISGYNADSTYTEWFRVYGDGGATQVLSTTVSTSATTGALTVAGGVGISKALFVSGAATASQLFINTLDVGATLANKQDTITAGTGLTKTGATLAINPTQSFTDLYVSNKTDLGGNGGLFSLIGTDHVYMQFYRTSTSGRTAYFGYQNSTSQTLQLNTGGVGNFQFDIVSNVNITGTLRAPSIGVNTAPAYPAHILSSTTANVALLRLAMPNLGSASPISTSIVYGSDGLGTGDITAKISFIRLNSSANNRTAIAFSTSASGASGTDVSTERLRINDEGVVQVLSTLDTGSVTTGALTVAGGVGIAKAMQIGGTVTLSGMELTFVHKTMRSPQDITIDAGAGFIYTKGNIMPQADSLYSLGGDGRKFTTVYAANGVINTSDARLKKDIEDIGLGLRFIDQLKPKTYKLIDVNSDKTHMGVIAQDLKEVLVDNGVDADQTALLYTGEDGMYSMNYANLIAPLIKAIQELNQKVEMLSAQINQ